MGFHSFLIVVKVGMLVECWIMLNKSVPYVDVREGGRMVVRLSGKISGWVKEPVRCEGAKMIGCALEVGGASGHGELSLMAQQQSD